MTEDVARSSVSTPIEELIPEIDMQLNDAVTETLDSIIDSSIHFCRTNNIHDPVEILRLLQKKIVTGRKLDLENSEETIDGDTNIIFINRDDILNTGFDEIQQISRDNLRKTLEVQFYGEVRTYNLVVRSTMKWSGYG
ncbi:hypothetical protein SNE40_023439 [Patella caerulea]|uniref:Uncharacterized protein n=1 Tax=Patella caerulea TaxID=87958 RepID=A0AAN8GGE2_PATCE